MNGLDVSAREDLALRLPLAGRQLIEASAGTGKTYTIAGLYARLIVEQRVPLRQILVMTFTRAATEELRHRLRERLALCARVADERCTALPGADETDAETAWAQALLQRTLATGKETAEALATRLRAAVRGMDEAAIFTIHGFCRQVLDAHASLLHDTVAGAELVASDRDLLEDFASEAWLRVAASDDVDELIALRQLAPSPEVLGKLLEDLVPFAGTIEPVADPLPATVDAASAWQALFEAWRTHGSEAVAAFDEWFRAGHFKNTAGKPEAPARLRRLAAELEAAHKLDASLLQAFAHAKLAASVYAGKPKFAPQPAFAAIDEWLAVDVQVQARCTAWQPRLLHRIVADARAWLARRKRDLARVSYGDLITRLATGVAGTGWRSHTLVEALRKQYPYALVDEFQDTDARQFGILDALYGDFGTLYMIGDPKQAIYGFRGGDVHAYLQAAKGVTHHPMGHNFRSAPALLAAVETVFGAREGGDAFMTPGITFEHVEAGGKTADGALQVAGAAVKPLTFWTRPQGELSADEQRDLMAQAAARTVADLLARGSVAGERLAPKQIGVLTRTNDEAALVQDALRACGAPAVCLRKESIYASREARDLLRVLDALLAPPSASLARGALATELMGMRLGDLARMTEDEAAWTDALDALADLHADWFTHGIAAMVARVASGPAARLLALADGERRLSNLLQLGDLLQADDRRLAGQRALRDALAAHIRDADAQNEVEQLRLESDAACVQIVTLHRSKGLEYDVVLMPFLGLGKVTEPVKGACARLHRGDQAVRRLILSGSKERTPADAEACEAALAEEQAEAVRLFYVGVTRARHACWLAAGGFALSHLVGGAGEVSALAAGHAASMVQVAPEDVPEAVAPAAVATPLGPARVATRRLPHDWWVHSFSQWAAGARDAFDAGGARDEAIATDAPAREAAAADIEVPTWPRGPRYGNAVHAILEKTVFADWRGCRGEVPASAAKLMERELRNAGFADAELEHASVNTAKLVAGALNVPVIDDLILADLAVGDRRAEMPFHFGIGGTTPAQILIALQAHGYQRNHADFAHLGARVCGLMTGILDLVFHHADQWWIVDYKTNNLGAHASDYSVDKLPVAIAAHDYDLQYIIYTVALHRWLRLTLGDAYDYERDVGGIRYLFLRGMTAGAGVFADKPPRVLIETLDNLLQARTEVAA